MNRRHIRTIVASAGLSALALSLSFNSVAHPALEEADAAAQTQTLATQSDAAQKQFKLNHDLAREVGILGQFLLTQKNANPAYNPKNDPHVRGNIDLIKTLIKDGGDINHNSYGALMVGEEAYSTAFSAMFQVSRLLESTELFDFMMERGADIKTQDVGGRGPMDHAVKAVIDAQDQSRADLRLSLKMMKRLIDGGLSLKDAEETIKIQAGTRMTDIIHNLASAEEFWRAGLIDYATYYRLHYSTPSATHAARTATTITADLLRDHGANVLDFSAVLPLKPFEYVIQDGDTLDTLAARFAPIMGTRDTEDSRRAIIAHNTGKLPPHAGQTLRIPVAVGQEIHTKPAHAFVFMSDTDATTSFEKIAKRVGTEYARPDADTATIAADLARINGMDVHAAVPRDRLIIVPYLYDSHAHLAPVIPGPTAGNKPVDLIVVERPAGDTGDHHTDTFRTATGTAFAINPKMDFTRFHAIEESIMFYPGGETSNILRALFNNAAAPLMDNVVFTHSMGMTRSEKLGDQKRVYHTTDTLLYRTTDTVIKRLDASKPIVFQAAGNDWYSGGGRYIQGYSTTHSPRAVIVGSSGMYKTKDSKDQPVHVISTYSSFGGDICAKQPNRRGEQLSGTSFSTPETAALYRQMASWYGDQLNFEEIIAAAMMTASRDVRDFENVGSFQSLFGSPAEVTLQSAPAEFVTNGGGLPHHDRCGPGILDVPAWHAAIQKMLVLKAEKGLTATPVSHTIMATPARITVGHAKKPEYVYQVRVPEDMTLGKLTFKFPHPLGTHGDIAVRTPAGFDLWMPKSFSETVSTFAFAYEDVKAGDMFTIRTTQPLAPGAGIILRGQPTGNSIAALRDALQAVGTLPKPLKTITGDKESDFMYPVDLQRPQPIAPTPIYPSRFER